MAKGYNSEEALSEKDVAEDKILALMDGEIDIDDLDKLGLEEPSDDPEEKAGDGDPEQKIDDDPEQEATDPEKNETPEEKEPEKVVLTKDGKHTIPYSELEAQRAAAEEAAAKLDEAEKRMAELQQELEAKTETEQAGDEDPELTAGQQQQLSLMTDEELAELEEDFPEVVKAFRAQQDEISLLKDDLTSMRDTVQKLNENYEASTADDAVNQHFQAIKEAHPEYDDLIESGELKAWVETQPSFVKQTYDNATTDEAIELIQMFKDANPGKKPEPKVENPKKKADELAAKLKEKDAPESLSDLSGGSNAATDEAEAMAKLSPEALQAKIDRMTPEQIDTWMARLS